MSGKQTMYEYREGQIISNPVTEGTAPEIQASVGSPQLSQDDCPGPGNQQ